MKNLLRKIFSPLLVPQHQTTENFTLPWGLTHSEWQDLQRLSQTEEFEVLRKTLDTVVNSYAEHMLLCEKNELLHFLRGKIVGVRYALEIVDEIHKKEKDYLINERRRNDVGGPGRSRVSTFGTPAWNGKSRISP